MYSSPARPDLSARDNHKELIANGHEVLGLARSDANAEALEKLGAKVHRGSLEDLDSLRKGAKETDGTIHLAFIHDFSKFAENGQIDKHAIDAMGEVLAGSDKPFIVTSGTLLVAPGRLATEDMRRDSARLARACPKQAGLAFAARGVRAMAVRLPQVHGGDGKCGLVNCLLEYRAGERRLRLYRRWRQSLGRGAPAGCGASLSAGAGERRGRHELSCRGGGRRDDARDIAEIVAAR